MCRAALAKLLAGYIRQEGDEEVSITASMVVIDLLISLGDTMCRYMSRSPSGSEASPISPRPNTSEGRDSLLLALLHRANSVPRPPSAKPGNRPATAGSRRLQEEWQTTPAGMADLALRWVDISDWGSVQKVEQGLWFSLGVGLLRRRYLRHVAHLHSEDKHLIIMSHAGGTGCRGNNCPL